jgi:fructose-specific phosphotransferase system IIA component
MKNLSDFTNENFIIKLKAREKITAIEELALVFKDTNVCGDINAMIQALKEREEIMSTGIGLGMAIPHARIKAVKKLSFAIGISANGIDFNSIDGKPAHLIVLIAAGEGQHKEYLHLLSKIMNVFKNEKVRKSIIASSSKNKIPDASKIIGLLS